MTVRRIDAVSINGTRKSVHGWGWCRPLDTSFHGGRTTRDERTNTAYGETGTGDVSSEAGSHECMYNTRRATLAL